MIEFPRYDRSSVVPVIDSPELQAYGSKPGLKFEPAKGDPATLWIEPVGELATEFPKDYDRLFVAKVREGDRSRFLVQLNLNQSDIGKLFDTAAEAVEYGLSLMGNREFLLLIQGLWPSPFEVVEAMADGRKTAGKPRNLS